MDIPPRSPTRRRPFLVGVAAGVLCAFLFGADGHAQAVPAQGLVALHALGLDPQVTLVRLPVSGRTFRRAMQHLDRSGPRAEDGSPRHGQTTFWLRPNWTLRKDGAVCVTGSVKVEVRIQMLLPEWTLEQRVPTAEQNLWRSFLASLTAHEESHRDFTLQAAAALARDLRSLTATSCPRLIDRADYAIRMAQEALMARHERLDNEAYRSASIR